MTVSSLNVTFGSTNGGDKISIIGSGFSNDYVESNMQCVFYQSASEVSATVGISSDVNNIGSTSDYYTFSDDIGFISETEVTCRLPSYNSGLINVTLAYDYQLLSDINNVNIELQTYEYVQI